MFFLICDNIVNSLQLEVHMEKKKLILLLFILLVIIYGMLYSLKKVDVTNYIICNEKVSQEFNDFKIVQLSDFHSSGYKDTTEIIINKVKEVNPDIIVMTGDMVSCEVKDIEEFEKLITSLSSLYPIYYINGNHEQLAEILRAGKYQNLLEELEGLDITFLRDNYVEITKGEQSINLYEIDIPLDGATGLYASRCQLESDYVENRLPKVDSSKFNILLAHNPIFLKQYSQWGADLVLSGHMHGGIIRIPIIDVGIFSAERWLFPRYDAGKFKRGNTTMIVNRGIGTSSFKLRIFNNPEITVITLKSK